MKADHYVGNRTFTIDICKPLKPGPGEVRLRVAYCGVCGTDLHIFHGAMGQHIKLPQVIGHEKILIDYGGMTAGLQHA